METYYLDRKNRWFNWNNFEHCDLPSAMIGSFASKSPDATVNNDDVIVSEHTARSIHKREHLVGGLEHEFYFSIIYGKFIIPTDDSSYFSEG